eukprot:1640485-Rhodomonas_salina.2
MLPACFSAHLHSHTLSPLNSRVQPNSNQTLTLSRPSTLGVQPNAQCTERAVNPTSSPASRLAAPHLEIAPPRVHNPSPLLDFLSHCLGPLMRRSRQRNQKLTEKEAERAVT